MSRRSFASLIASVLITVSAARLTPGSVLAMTSSTVPGARVLYHTTWKTGLKGWDVQPGYTISNGVLSYDGRGSGDATAPFRTKHVKNFAVVATIQAEGFTNPKLHSFGPFVRYTLKNRDAGVYPGSNFLYGSTSAATLFWRGNNENLAIGALFDPGTDFHVYRAEVRGNRYRLLIDGSLAVPWTIIDEHRSLAGVGVTGFYAKINVKDFKVLALGVHRVKSAEDTRPLEARALKATEVGMSGGSGSFRDNAVFARENNLDEATLKNQGRLYGYKEQFSDGTTTVVEDLQRYRSASGAKWGFEWYVKQDQDRGYHPLTPLPAGIGDESAAFTNDNPSLNLPRYGEVLELHRGVYDVRIATTSTDAARAQSATSLAQKADQNLQAAG